MKIKSLVAGMLALAASLQASCDITVGPGMYSSFATDAGSAVVVGVSGLSWSDFNAHDSYGTKCFVHDSVVDAEKTAANNDDDYWCGPITDMNLLYITGWSRKTSYATVDDMVDYFRSNVKLLRYAKTPGDMNTVTEGTYGYNNNPYYDGIWRWFKATTRVDLTSFIKKGQGVNTSVLRALLDKGEYALHVDMLFDDSNSNPKWGGMMVSHSVTCCGYETDAMGNLKGLFIIDSDNDQYGDANGGRAAPNSILYCPVSWNAAWNMYAVEGIWGETSYLLDDYTALQMYRGETKSVKLDANGGKVSPATINVLEDSTYGELPEPTKADGGFEGWWTAKEGGVQVQEGDPVDFSIFANPKTPTLYAQWRKACKITVAGGFLNDGTTSRGGLFRGEVVEACVDWDKLNDKSGNWVNAFANWTYTPATADLGEGFDSFSPEVVVTMPNADVKLTANFVNGFAAYLNVYGYTEGESGEGDFYWSIDNGKTLIPLGGLPYPVKAGKVTVKFYDKKGNWRASDITLTVNKRNTYKSGSFTYYEDPQEVYLGARFVPVNGSTKVKFDANGGNASWEEFLANGYEYGSLRFPERKGYVFAGWWTAKDGGEHITMSGIFDPADFAGQKTPTLYAHWLQLKKLTLKDESAYASGFLNEEDFDPELYSEIMASLYTSNPEFGGGWYLEGKGTIEVLPGARVYLSAPESTTDKSGNGLAFQKWTVTPSKANLGSQFRVSSYDTTLTMPAEDVTLQASYIDASTSCTLDAWVNVRSINIGYDYVTGGVAYIDPPYAAFEWSPDNGSTWYKAWPSYDAYDEYGNEIYGETALLKPGTYTVTWRSTDPHWAAPTTKTKVVLNDSGSCCGMSTACSQTVASNYEFTYVPEVVVDVMTYSKAEGIYVKSSAGGTVSPTSGFVPLQKTISLTAKANKDYTFQGYAFGRYWGNSGYLYFDETVTTWKLGNYGWLTDYIDPQDHKVHVVASFKAVADYSVEDIAFFNFRTSAGGAYGVVDDVVNIRAVVGCAVENSLYSAPAAFPLTYKLEGKLPDGLKFDAKTGVLSGAPKKVGTATVKIVASDPAKHSKALTVNIRVDALPSGFAGEYRGLMRAEEYDSASDVWDYTGQQEGILEMTVKSDGKVSAKVITRLGSRSVSGTLEWNDPELTYYNEYGDEYQLPEFRFWHTDAKDASYCHVNFNLDGTIDGEVDSYDKTEGDYVGGGLTGLYQNKELLAKSNFFEKYYTFAFCAVLPEESEPASGHGYLTVKTDRTGGAKVTGQLPDGEKVSMSALVMPFALETTEGVGARLYLFASPSSYKKLDWFATTLVLDPAGYVSVTPDGGAWTIADVSPELCCGLSASQWRNATVTGEGALYSEAKPLEGYYGALSCAWSSKVTLEYSYKYLEENEDNPSKPYSWTEYGYAPAADLDGYFFNVEVKGDKKGAISLAEKNNALSLSFAKATGIFSGKATVTFDYELPSCKQNSKTKEIEWSYTLKHTTASMPYAGVMIADGDGYMGLGAAVHSFKYSYEDEKGKIKTDTKKVSLPVSLELESPAEP